MVVDLRRDGGGVYGIPDTALGMKRKAFIAKYRFIFATSPDANELAAAIWDMANPPAKEAAPEE